VQFTVSQITDKDGFNQTAEVAAAAAYPWVRTMTVGQTTTSTFPLQQFAVAPIQPWASIADPAVINKGAWSATSAACWFYGRGLTDALKVPIGLVSSNWGGTIIQSWSNNATNRACNITEAAPTPVSAGGASPLEYVTKGFEARVAAGPDPNHGYGVLYNAMIAPLVLGPMAISSIIWFQGESNNGQDALYACMQPGMIRQWRADFGNAAAFFGFVEMEPWIGGPVASFRPAQLAALSLPLVGYGTATDAGDPTGPDGSIHPRNKKLIGGRLAAAALDLQYKVPAAPWRSPTYATGKASTSGASVSVTVTFTDVPTTLVPAADHCKTELGVPAAQCAWFSIVGSDGKAYNATATPTGSSLVLTASVPAGVTASASTFGYNSWPINTVMTAEGLPLQPWDVTPVA